MSIADAPAYESALKLLLLWRPNLESGWPVSASEPIIIDARLPTPKPTDIEQPPTPQPESPDWVALSKYSPPAGTQCPATIRFWDGSERTLEYWYEVLTLVVEKLHSEGLLTVDDTPISSGTKTYMVNTEPVHPTGKPFRAHRRINGTPLFINVKLNAWQVRSNAKILLQRYDQNPTDAYLRAAQ